MTDHSDALRRAAKALLDDRVTLYPHREPPPEEAEAERDRLDRCADELRDLLRAPGAKP